MVMARELDKVANLKNLVRTGWSIRGIPPAEGETVADHIFETSVIALVITDELLSRGVGIDQCKVLKMAILHDVPEAVEGDIVKWSKDRLGNTENLDEDAMKELGLAKYVELISEFNNIRSTEAVIVKIADHLSTLLQGIRYLRRGYSDVEDIVKGCRKAVEKLIQNLSPEIREVLKDILAELMRNIREDSKAFNPP